MPEAKEPVILSPEKIPQHADDTDVLVDKIIGMVKGYSPNANTDMIYVAYKLAKSAHSHQFRRIPYVPPQSSNCGEKFRDQPAGLSNKKLLRILPCQRIHLT